jgi:hypothetical protein
MSALNPDVFAGDILRKHYREQMDIHASKAREAAELRDSLESVEAQQRTAAERATSIMETLARYGGMLPASVDRNPQGQDREDGLGAKHESAVAKPDAQKGSA